MKVFVAGATGVIGRALVPQLVARGHEVVGMTRSASKQELVRGLGARPVVADALEPDAVARAVASVEPEVIVHQLTELSGPMSMRNARHPDRSFAGRGCAPPDRRRPCTSNRTRSSPVATTSAARGWERFQRLTTRGGRARRAARSAPPATGGVRTATATDHRSAMRTSDACAATGLDWSPHIGRAKPPLLRRTGRPTGSPRRLPGRRSVAWCGPADVTALSRSDHVPWRDRRHRESSQAVVSLAGAGTPAAHRQRERRSCSGILYL
jgi:NAD dependent epimerase/dehydratase family